MWALLSHSELARSPLLRAFLDLDKAIARAQQQRWVALRHSCQWQSHNTRHCCVANRPQMQTRRGGSCMFSAMVAVTAVCQRLRGWGWLLGSCLLLACNLAHTSLLG